MAVRRKQRSFSTFLSVLGHAALVALLFYGVPLARTERTAIADGNPVNTIMVSEIPYVVERQRIEDEAAQQAIREREAAEAAEAERQQREAAEQAERDAQRIADEKAAAEAAAAAEAEAEKIRLQLQAEADQKRLDEERIAAEKAAEEKRQQEEAERIAAEEERKRQEEEERQQRLAAEAALQRQRDQIASEIAAVAAAEEADRMARESGLLDQWIRAIEARVTSRWIEPPNRSPNLDCMLDVDLLPDGSVTNVRVSQCSNADDNVIRSLDNAVRQSSPLPRRPDGLAYQPSLSIRFRPND